MLVDQKHAQILKLILAWLIDTPRDERSHLISVQGVHAIIFGRYRICTKQLIYDAQTLIKTV